MSDIQEIIEIEIIQAERRKSLKTYIKDNEKTSWLNRFGIYPDYPAKSAVEASKAQLYAMDQAESIRISSAIVGNMIGSVYKTTR